MTEIEIVREDAETGGRYVGRIAGCAGEAELVFSKAGAELLVAEHTEVPDSMRGTGTGVRLLARMVDDARRAGYAILARCTFVRAQAGRHPEWSDVLRT